MKGSKEVTPNDETLRYYFYFVQERMNMFWRKVEGKFIYTEDPKIGRASCRERV